MRQLLFRDSDSRVAYIKLHTLFLLFISHMDAARGGKLQGIVHEIGDDLMQPVPVTYHSAIRRMRIEHQFNSLGTFI